MCNVSNPELEALALWSNGVCNKHYSKWAVADTVSKMAGFRDASSFNLDRQLPDFEDFRLNKGGDELFSIFMPGIFDPELERNVHLRDDEIASDVLKSLRLIARVFWQDLPHYFLMDKELKVFKCAALVEKWDLFLRWVDYVQDSISQYGTGADSGNSVVRRAGDERAASQWQAKMERSVIDTKTATVANTARIDRLIFLMETKGEVPKKRARVTEDMTERKECTIGSGLRKPIIKEMRKLNSEFSLVQCELSTLFNRV